MAITAQQKTNLLGVTSFMFNYAPDRASLARFEAAIEANPSFYALGSQLAATSAFANQFPEDATRDEKIDLVLSRVGLEEGSLGYTRGVDFINQRLDDGVPAGQVLIEIGEKLLQSPAPEGLEEASAVLRNKIAVSDAYLNSDIQGYSNETLPDLLDNVTADPASVSAGVAAIAEYEAEEPVEPGVPGETYILTEGRDNIVGTENDDTFIGDVGQNQNGAISNALSTGDRLDGAGGRNTIEASMIQDNEVDSGVNQAPRPVTQNIQEVYIEALQGNTTEGGNVVLDATRMANVEQYWSNFSRSDMTFSGVNLNGSNLNITKDVTFGMRDVDFDSGLRGAFESQSLVRAPATQVNSQLQIRIADVSTETPTTPLANVDLNLSFNLGDQVVSLEGLRSTDGTYAGLVEALRADLSEAGLGRVNVSLSEPYEQVSVAGNTVNLPFTAQEILVTDAAGNAFSNVNFTQRAIEPVADGFLVAGNAAPVDPASTSNLIETNLILDNAGRGSTAGDVTIGGMSNSGTVVEKLNLEVDRNSKVDNVFSASGMGHGAFNEGTEVRTAFQQIEVTSGAAQGDLSIGNVGNVYNFDATAFAGENLTVGGWAGVLNTGGDWEPNAEARAHVYNTANDAGSNDTVNVAYSHDKAAEFNGFSLAINTGEGNDTIHTLAVRTDGNNLPNQQDLQQNVNINAGNGNNTVWTEGAGGVTVTSGTGNDTIYTDNSGASLMTNEAQAATWVVNTQEVDGVRDFDNLRGNTAELSSGVGSTPALLANAQVTVAFSGAATGGALTSGAAVANQNGFESTVSLNDILGDRVFGTQADVNAGIAQAINSNYVLNKLLQAELGPDNSLVIRSMVDGEFSADDLAINVFNNYQVGASTTADQRLVQAIREEANDSELTVDLQSVIDGSTAAANSVSGMVGSDDGSVLAQRDGLDLTGTASEANNTGNIVNAGAGNDVIVLSTNGESSETVQFTGYNNGYNTIVNFDSDYSDDDTGDLNAGADLLDFSAYLTTLTSSSGSVESQQLVDYTVEDTSGALSANSVSIVEFASTVAGNSFAFNGITSENLVAALNGTADIDFGGLGASTSLSTIGSGQFVGNTYNSVLMIEDNLNAGKYQAWDVTVGQGADGAGSATATGAQLIGTYDFGNSLTGLDDASLVA
ncbi:beta strand repeat-containing protein [Halomonas sp. HNIBRBA4712]|uniref:beta strand repeat-containing protein n=1 Tax=Halomonas sp. HNIBRBA4712 TaxID=3373087 RepID=UPI003745CA56